MSEATRTPGPFAISRHATHVAQFGIYSESVNSGRDLAIVCNTGNDDETAANAALFAAAPDMLKALRAIADCDESDLAKYCAAVDSIAIEALISIECGQAVQS